LEHLAEIWPVLLHEEETSLRLASDAEREEFEDSHDLAYGIQGAWLPTLRIVRSGDLAIVELDDGRHEASWRHTSEFLENLGEMLAARVKAARDDPRATSAVEAWRDRDDISPERASEIYTGKSLSELRRLEKLSGVELVPTKPDFKPTPLLAAARLAGATISDGDWKRLLVRIRDTERQPPPRSVRLAGLSRKARAELREHVARREFEQGYQIAAAIRHEIPGVEGPLAPVDMDEVFKLLEIEVVDLQLETRTFDAVAVWFPDAARIFINTNGVHAQHRRGRQATLAHELCHLLLDRESALPLAEIKGGLTPDPLERRANAFAAELLFPEDVIAHYLARVNVSTRIDYLAARYGASRKLIAHQFLNRREQELDHDTRAVLLQITDRPAAW
jgi:Zn-dependent peptidase ImmA (M78 family)